MKTNLTVIILSYNEEKNIHFALENIKSWANQIIVVDSFSNDKTLEILDNYSIDLYSNQFKNFKEQRTFALRNTKINNDWVLFLDADEILTKELKTEISTVLQEPFYDGYLIKRRFYFMGKWIKYGGYYPSWNLRLFKHSLASVNREINEHIEINGSVGSLRHDMIDENHKDFSSWIKKHDDYSNRECQSLLTSEKDDLAKFWGNSIERKRWVRLNIWNKLLPPLIRPFLYFIYRYFIRLGFLDGKIGFIYHFNHALVYRLFIDIKFIEKKCAK